jgi:hypothetical protein
MYILVQSKEDIKLQAAQNCIYVLTLRGGHVRLG